ncbi:NRT2 ribosyltransferase, partial [Sitta europaea]|nr:NRT2 ribosyltransferase [Sitta europaea]
PLPSMALLAHTLALLAMAVATVAIEVVPLDMAPDSFDDQYQGCGPAMTKALKKLNQTEFQGNRDFATGWVKAVEVLPTRVSSLDPLSPAQAIAVMAYSMKYLYIQFNSAVRTAGRSGQEYRENFHFKALHFLLTQALRALRVAQGPQCHDVFRGVKGVRFVAQLGQKVRFGQFASTSLSRAMAEKRGTDTVFQVHTCHGADIRDYAYDRRYREVLIPPFEVFKVIKVFEEGGEARIHLSSTGTFSNYNCEWLRGNSTG